MAAPLVDTAGGATGTNTTYNIALTIAANSNRVLYVFVQDPTQAGGIAVVWNTSETVTEIGSGTVNTNDDWHIYRLIAPSSGSANVTVTCTSGPHAIIALSVYDCDQTTPNDAIDPASGSGTAATNAVASEAGDLAVCFGASTGSSTWAPASGETEIFDTAASGAVYSLAGETTATFDATLGTSRAWMFIGMNLNAVAAGGDPESSLVGGKLLDGGLLIGAGNLLGRGG